MYTIILTFLDQIKHFLIHKCYFRCLSRGVRWNQSLNFKNVWNRSDGGAFFKKVWNLKMSQMSEGGGGQPELGHCAKFSLFFSDASLNCYTWPLVEEKRLRYFVPCVQYFMDFQYNTFRDFYCLKISLTWSIFELEKCSFHMCQHLNSCKIHRQTKKQTNRQTLSSVQNRTGWVRTGPVRTGQGYGSLTYVRTGQHRSEWVRTGHDGSGWFRTGQDGTGQDGSGKVRTGCQDKTGNNRKWQQVTGINNTGQDRKQ